MPPEAEIKADQKEAALRKLHLTVKSQRNAIVLYLGFNKDVEPVSVQVAGRDVPVHQNRDGFSIRLFGMGDKETDLQLTLKESSSISF